MSSAKSRIQVSGVDESLFCVDVKGEKCALGGERGRLVIVDGLKSNPKIVAETSIFGENDVPSLCFGKPQSNSVYCASGREVFVFDLRNITKWVQRYSYNSDEINHIVVTDCGKYLACSDDSGQIKVVNLRENYLKATLKKHSNVCYVLLKRPHKQWQIVSGGYDCCCNVWDINRSQMLQTFDINSMTLNSRIPFVNPPYVLCLDFSAEGGLLAAGLQDGNIQLWDSSQDQLTPSELMNGAHSTLGVTQVRFVKTAGVSPTLLFTGGNDGILKVWDVMASCESPKYFLSHGAKINCMAVTENTDVLVCDVSPYLSIYDAKTFS